MVLDFKTVVCLLGITALTRGSLIGHAVAPAPIIAPALSYTRGIPYSVPPFAASINLFTRLPPPAPIIRVPAPLHSLDFGHVRSLVHAPFAYAPVHPHIPRVLPPLPPAIPHTPHFPETPVVHAAPQAPLPDPLPFALPGPYHYPVPEPVAHAVHSHPVPAPAVHYDAQVPLQHAVPHHLHQFAHEHHLHEVPAPAPLLHSHHYPAPFGHALAAAPVQAQQIWRR